MKWKKLVTLGCVVVMTVSSVTACGSNTTENQTVEATEQSEENQSDSVIVQVTAVDGLITLTPSGMDIGSRMLDRHHTLTKFLMEQIGRAHV